MTIAIGAMSSAGVLLCADTLHTGGTLSFHDTKIFYETYTFGTVAFTFAGHVDFARAVIQECQAALAELESKAKPIKRSDILKAIKQTVSQEYKEHVFKHPNYLSHLYDYGLIIAIWTAEDGLAIYSSCDTVIKRCVSGLECTGVGSALTRYLVQPAYKGKDMALPDVLLACAYAIARAKEYVPDCGGRTEVIIIEPDGSVRPSKWFRLAHLERYSRMYDSECRFILSALAKNRFIEKQEFDACLNLFCIRLRELFDEWKTDDEVDEIVSALQEKHST